MAKKRSSGKHYVSKGQHSTVKRSTLRDMREERRKKGARLRNQQDAFIKGKNVVLTIENPDPKGVEEGRPFIRVNAKDVWKSYKFERYANRGS